MNLQKSNVLTFQNLSEHIFNFLFFCCTTHLQQLSQGIATAKPWIRCIFQENSNVAKLFISKNAITSGNFRFVECWSFDILIYHDVKHISFVLETSTVVLSTPSHVSRWSAPKVSCRSSQTWRCNRCASASSLTSWAVACTRCLHLCKVCNVCRYSDTIDILLIKKCNLLNLQWFDSLFD